ncbi:MAG: glycerophosphodiester phosphodiesterase family protein [Tatlockia sp.]|jgi:glycerophosphoryl diester phosphodiesterase
MPVLHLLEKCIDGFIAATPREKPEKSLVDNSCLIAHRGAHDKKSRIIENTDSAFARALSLGCYGIELDVHATKDGVLVVNHDPTLKRLWHKNEAIAELPFKTLRQLTPEIPSLDEVVARYGKKLHLFIELKAPFHAGMQLNDALKPLNASTDYHLLSLDEPLFTELNLFPREVMLLVAVHNNVSRFSTLCLEKNYGGVLGHYLLLTNRKLNELINAQKAVGVGMIDSKFGLYRELNRGMQWLFSNQVERVTQCLRDIK